MRQTEDVMSIIKGGGEYMVVIGNQLDDKTNISDEKSDISEDKKPNIIMWVLNTVIGAIMPALHKWVLYWLSILGQRTKT